MFSHDVSLSGENKTHAWFMFVMFLLFHIGCVHGTHTRQSSGMPLTHINFRLSNAFAVCTCFHVVAQRCHYAHKVVFCRVVGFNQHRYNSIFILQFES
jgi:hypothetical protein